MASAAVAKRRGASTTKAEAKQRKQRIFVVVMAVVLAVLLVYQVPRTLKMVSKSETPPVTAAPSVPATAPHSSDTKRLHWSGNGADPFALRGVSNGDTRVAPAGGPDPFMAPQAATHAAPTHTAAALPAKIVIGRPGGHRVAQHGFIVILASIPTRNGRGAATSFARQARRNVGRLSILNSSNSRPLRGGYWVVYAGPYSTLGGVTEHAGSIHAAGYRTAYIRQLIAYK